MKKHKKKPSDLQRAFTFFGYTSFDVIVNYTFNKDEIKNAGGVAQAFEQFGDSMTSEIDVGFEITLWEYPKKRNKKNLYIFSFNFESNFTFYEHEIEKWSGCKLEIDWDPTEYEPPIEFYKKYEREIQKSIEFYSGYNVTKVQLYLEDEVYAIDEEAQEYPAE